MASAHAGENAIDPFDETFGAGLGSGPTEPDNFCITCAGATSGDTGCDFAGDGFPGLVGLGEGLAAETITVDNLGNTSQTGIWPVSSGPFPFGDNSFFNNISSTFRWIPDVVVPGNYDVFAYWTFHVNRATNVPYSINHAGGLDTVNVNQNNEAQAAQFNLLGNFAFNAGTSGFVEVSSENGQASADAVRLVPTP